MGDTDPLSGVLGIRCVGPHEARLVLCMTICSAVQLGVIALSMAALSTMQVIVSIGCLLVLSTICLLWYKKHKNEIHTTVDEKELL